MEVEPGTALLGLAADLMARVAMPKPARRVRLVRRLVLGEPDVAIDPEQRALGIAGDLGREPRQSDVQLFDQRAHRCADVVLVTLAMRLEPRLVVVAGEAAQESERRGSEHDPAKLSHFPCARTPKRSSRPPPPSIIPASAARYRPLRLRHGHQTRRE